MCRERIYAIPTKKRKDLITMVVDNLEKRALVRRVRSPEDRRSARVTLTEGGKRLIESIFPQHVQSIVAEFEVLTSGE